MVRVVRASRKKLGEILMETGLVSEAQVEDVIRTQRETGELFGDLMIDKGYVSEGDIAKAMVTQFHLPYISLSNVQINTDVKGIFPVGIMNKNLFVPFDKVGNILLVATAGVIDVEILEELETSAGCPIRVFVTTVNNVRKAITEHFTEEDSLSEMGALLLGDV